MEINERIGILKLYGGLEIRGKEERVTEFFKALRTAIGAMKELQQYRHIGTLEECREAREKQMPIAPAKTGTIGYRYTDTYRCPRCMGNFSGTGIADYCYHCGQAIKWEGEQDE